jgi:hypothetical protein
VISFRQWQYLLSGALIMLCLSVRTTSTYADGTAYRFPLWKDVPGKSFSVLKHGLIGGTEWAAFASRAGAAPTSRDKPCITVAEFTKEGSYSNAGGCGWLAPEMGLRYPPISPLIGEVDTSVFAISFARQVLRVEIELGSGEVIVRTPRTLTPQQARKARLPRLGYVAMAIGTDACISRIKGFSGIGELILDSETHEC